MTDLNNLQSNDGDPRSVLFKKLADIRRGDHCVMTIQTRLRWRAMCGLTCGAVVLVASLVTLSPAADPQFEHNSAALAELAGVQPMLKLPVRVVDADGKPVAGAKVTPWALRSSQGHGWWRENDERAGTGPKHVITDHAGTADIVYPRYRDLRERISTVSVSLYVDHPRFAYVDNLHIDVPLEGDSPYDVELPRGVSLEVRPTIDGELAELDNLFALWSDGRSWQSGAGPEKTADGGFRFPAMTPGANSLLLVKLKGDQVTHFSELTEFEFAAGRPKRIDLPLRY